MFDEMMIPTLRSALRGHLIEPSDSEYEEARKLHNGMMDKHPRMIVKCADVADVIACVNFARTNNIVLSIRSGGHNAGGLGLCNDGLAIDLSKINNVRVDPIEREVVVGGGATWGEVDHATHAFGLAVPAGIISTTGVGGLTLGGGIGHLTRRYGLTIDNLLAVDIVLADGSFVTASATKNEDLFWAVRGGGGNFGVVTAFTFRAHPVETVIGGPMLWPLSEASKVLRWYRKFLPQSSTELNGFFAFLTVPPGPPFPEHLHFQKMCGIVWSFTGHEQDKESVFGPIRALLPPALDLVGPLPVPVLQSMFDPLCAPGLQYYWKADFYTELTDAAIEKHVEFAKELPTMLSTMHLYPVDGAAARVGKNETAWSFREAKWAKVIVGIDPDPALADALILWARAYWEALHPYSAGGAYINFMMEEGEDRIKATYRDNYERLAKIKRRYDPENLFRTNQNIKPAISKTEDLVSQKVRAN